MDKLLILLSIILESLLTPSSDALSADLVLSNKLVLYDLEKQAIGWTEYNCEPIRPLTFIFRFFLTITLLFSPFFSIVGGHMSLFRKFRRKISADEQEIKEKKKCGWSDSGEKVDLMMIRGWLQVLRASECRTIEQGRFSRSTPTTSRRGSRRPRRDSSCCCRLFPPC